MVAMVCDLCGGKLIIGVGGIATCESCGMDHSADRMKEKVQEIKGTVRVDSSHMIENYLKMANNAYASNNKAEAESYCNKIIEIEPQNFLAWFMKGRASGWQSTLVNVRFSEAINCFANAIESAPDDKRNEYIDDSKKEIQELANALILLRAENFAKWPDKEEADGFIKSLTEIFQALMQFVQSIGSSIDTDILMSPIVITIATSILDTWNEKIVPDFISDNDGYPSDYAFSTMLEQAQCCRDLLSKCIDLCDSDDDVDIIIYNSLISINTFCMDHFSYTYETVLDHYSAWDGLPVYENKYIKSKVLSDSAKSSLRSLNTQYQSKIVAINEKVGKEKAQRINEYWESHSEDKIRLDAEKKLLSEEIEALEKEISQIPGNIEKLHIQERIKKIMADKDALSIFKGKEKKALQEQIDAANAEMKPISDKIDLAEEEIQKKIDPLQSRITEIENEIRKER